LRGIKAQCDEDRGRILLGDNTGGGAVMLSTIRFLCTAVRISAGLDYVCLIYVHSIPICAGSSVTLLLRKSWSDCKELEMMRGKSCPMGRKKITKS